ncbi:MAG: family 20 glycosylhydrolase [Fuerstiella sp.]|nr:family 20 glycosylhydrolase [Fuerstiella sp.]MCP4855527.1 family 20 glycosylhydrolase [Fuerstiella sp.]
MDYWTNSIVVLAFLFGSARLAPAQQASDLRLVPFPKQVQLRPTTFKLDRRLVVDVPDKVSAPLGELITQELARVGLPSPRIRVFDGQENLIRVAAESDLGKPRSGMPKFRDKRDEEDYALDIQPNEIVCAGHGEAGLYYGVQTLIQLIRANRQGTAIPCLAIQDWPSLRWRAFQDDMTRGPSSTLDTLKFEAATGAYLKMNLFTYYMVSQYAFRKHPDIGPPDGSLEPDDLKALVEYARLRHVDILGNQQSFGHLSKILKHDQYAHLRESPNVICPVTEESYQLLDDLYSEVCPLLPFPWFNVCCDETAELGTGPSRKLAEEIGVGGVYVRHIRRVHDLLKDKYDKRMMMWGDIILKHPDKLDQIPKDTIMLTWNYSAQPSFEERWILPFARSGYDFFVCPGINNWGEILPDFDETTTNIRNFVRDGVKHGALGMLNTAWEDGGEALQGYKWHGYAWGAECAWSGSATTPEEFSRRIGAVLFGEEDDHFGQAIGLLARTHRLPGMQGRTFHRFWVPDLPPSRNPAVVNDQAKRLLDIVRPAIEHLETCKAQATTNKHLLDCFLLGARRMEFIGQRMLDGLEACRAYTEASQLPPADAVPLVEKAHTLVARTAETYDMLGQRFARIWLAECKPYALDRVTGRHANAVKRYDDLAARLKAAKDELAHGRPVPSPESIGLALPEAFARRTWPHQIIALPLTADAPWSDPSATHRVGLVIKTGSVERFQLPVEVNLGVPGQLASKPVRAFCSVDGMEPAEIPAQFDALDKPDRTRLSLIIPVRVAKDSQATVWVYLGGAGSEPLPGAVSTKDAPNGMKWIENDKVRLLLGPEGGHVYRWQVKGLGNRDLTMPGEAGWSGFSDLGHAHRNSPNKLQCTARGPAVVRYVCSDTEDNIKTITLFAGCSWIEVVPNDPVGTYWDFDNPRNFAADGPTPGSYLFSNGQTGPVGKQADGVPAQVKQNNAFWSVKFNPDGLALGIATPEVASSHVLAPGGGAGGVGIERSALANHFVTYAGLLDAPPRETMTRLQTTLNFKNQPQVVVHAIQRR